MTSAFERLLADLSEAEVDYILVPVDDENIARLLQVLLALGRDRQLSFDRTTLPLRKEPYASSKRSRSTSKD